VRPGEFQFAAAYLDHDHIYGMCDGLVAAGAELSWVFDPQADRLTAFQRRFPHARAARSLDEVLADPRVALVASAGVPCEHWPTGRRVIESGKDYFVDKPPFTSLSQLGEAREAVARTGRKYAVYYGERVHVESAVHAGRLVAGGAIGRVVHVAGFGPHRLNATSRPPWFFEKARYGGIICDIGSHQAEQFLFFSGAEVARVTASRVANYAHPEYPELEDFGDFACVADNGVAGYHRVDWFTPSGLRAWGDGRLFLVGTDGQLEIRKYVDVARDATGDHLFLANAKGERQIDALGKVGFPFFGELIRDCLERAERAMSQAHAFAAAELALEAEARAERIA
jgi:predicted dehydrogenase